jgi:hypothetical protein
MAKYSEQLKLKVVKQYLGGPFHLAANYREAHYPSCSIALNSQNAQPPARSPSNGSG